MTNEKHHSKLTPKEEALDLIDFAKEEEDMDAKDVCLLLKELLVGVKVLEDWDWRIVKYIEEKTGAVLMEQDTPRFYEPETLGLPEGTSEDNDPIDYKILNRDFLLALFQAIQDIAENIPDRINKFLDKKKHLGWRCECGWWLGGKLDSYDEVRKFISMFSFNKYRLCKRCKKQNWFEINKKGDIHFHLID